MSKLIIKDFIQEIIDKCIDKGIASHEVPGVLLNILLEVQCEESLDEMFDRVTERCAVTLNDSIEANMANILEEVINRHEEYLEHQLRIIVSAYQGSGYSYEEAMDKAIKSEYIQRLDIMTCIFKEMLDENMCIEE